MSNIRVDDDLKQEADQMFEAVGMNTATAVKIFLTRFVQTGEFPFEIKIIKKEFNEESLQAFSETAKIIQEKPAANTESLDDYFAKMKTQTLGQEDAGL
ncbi:type II toxin-antitoxin system RelB/DinJ family antitoxin [Enterococcus timonensis]|uniref:type II toxin-antitoxin system RelB/DinJ family antitoxin n=1 Tax=Enterococcus timonensis TaxID=1852364 RepID=UPI0008DA9172|nr:type II toxin-antitoxin system RelB/DinJ family antitoxin [Enterococcus timonensis]